MDVISDLKGLFAETTKRMNTALEHVRHELAGVRTGRASVAILDGVMVDAYGSKMPLNQLAGLSVPRPTRTPAAWRARSGAAPHPRNALEIGQCATRTP